MMLRPYPTILHATAAGVHKASQYTPSPAGAKAAILRSTQWKLASFLRRPLGARSAITIVSYTTCHRTRLNELASFHRIAPRPPTGPGRKPTRDIPATEVAVG